MLQFALAENFNPATADSPGEIWLEALPARIYHTPMYGEVQVPVEKLERMVKGFKEKIRGQEIATNFDHGVDVAKGNKASGWFKDFAVKPSSSDPTQMSLYAAVDFTEEAKKEIKAGQWKYFSLEWEDTWKDNAGTEHQDVVVGGAITNRPIAKDMATLPVNFSESNWNELTDEEKAKITKFNEEVQAATTLLEGAGFKVVNESKEWEHSEPGTGPTPQIGSPEQPDPGTGQPVPRIQGDPSKEDPAIGGGWRRSPLPLDPSDPGAPKAKRDEGGSVLTPEELAELRKKLELPEDADIPTIITAAGVAFSETASLKQAVAVVGEEKNFSEQYPTMWAEHQRLKKEGNENRATAFSESVKVITRTEGEKQVASGNGLSQLAQDTVKEVYLKFSEGTATTEDFENAVKTIVQGGIVDFGESGSAIPAETPAAINTDTAGGVASVRKQFAEKVTEMLAADDKLDYNGAVRAAATKYPELASAYRATSPA